MQPEIEIAKAAISNDLSCDQLRGEYTVLYCTWYNHSHWLKCSQNGVAVQCKVDMGCTLYYTGKLQRLTLRPWPGLRWCCGNPAEAGISLTRFRGPSVVRVSEKINRLSVGKFSSQSALKYAVGYIRLGNVSGYLFGKSTRSQHPLSSQSSLINYIQNYDFRTLKIMIGFQTTPSK